MLTLQVVIASTRPNRAGLPIGRWFFEHARAHGKFNVELVDLKEVNLPFLDEEKHPRFGQYALPHTQAWAAIVKRADAFVFVTPEYNYSMPPTLLNALDCLGPEWAYKAASFVSYGGVSGGTRSVQVSKQVLTCLKIMPIPEQVAIPFFSKLLEGSAPDQVFKGETQEKAASGMLDELHRWAGALKTLRS